jgi:cytochrome c biogenesis protein CcdA
MQKKIAARLFSIALILLGLPCAYGQQKEAGLPTLMVFYSLSCHRCEEVKIQVLPEIEKKFSGRINIAYFEIGDIQNYKLLVGLKEKHGIKASQPLPVFYFQGHFLGGEGDVRTALEWLLTESLKNSSSAASPVSGPATPAGANVDLVAHFKSFAPLAVVSAGLIDGINPCAFTVIVFFISFLALQGYRRGQLVAIGLTFIFAVFLTYLLIGVGLLGFLYQFRHFWVFVKFFNFFVGVLSLFLGALALYDFFRFKKTGQTDGMVLQLPQAVKQQIHSVIGRYYRRGKPGQAVRVADRPLVPLLLSALVTGFLVSILEAVCTGQVYLPTITFVLKASPLKIQALGYLLLYNAMFIAPLVAIFLFALLGVTSAKFSEVMRRHFLAVKMLMAILFFGLGAFLLLAKG